MRAQHITNKNKTTIEHYLPEMRGRHGGKNEAKNEERR
jgi:hypothetical protein